MYKIHYAKLDLQGDIPCVELQSFREAYAFIESVLYPETKNKVYLLAVEDEIFISETASLICKMYKDAISYSKQKEIFLQEYQSYEDAYRVALDMKEVSALCYND